MQRVSPDLIDFYNQFRKKNKLDMPFSKWTGHTVNILKQNEENLAKKVQDAKNQPKINKYRERPAWEGDWL